jgi:hypothetical protein
MSRIVLDEKTAAQLQASGEATEVVTASGTHVGYFYPARPASSAKTDCPYSEEDLERIRLNPANRQGRPLAQVWDTLRQRGIPIP